ENHVDIAIGIMPQIHKDSNVDQQSIANVQENQQIYKLLIMDQIAIFKENLENQSSMQAIQHANYLQDQTHADGVINLL
ncbi:MAG: hypothetical protein ACKO96_06980, partial [Flammeovirgaceae bacterium]